VFDALIPGASLYVAASGLLFFGQPRGAGGGAPRVTAGRGVRRP